MLIELLFAGAVQCHAHTALVQPGDTLSKIGTACGYSWGAIYDANRLILDNPNRIQPGQILQLPMNRDQSLGFSSSEDEVVVMAGQSLSEIGAKLGYDWHKIAQINGISAPYTIQPGQILRLP